MGSITIIKVQFNLTSSKNKYHIYKIIEVNSTSKKTYLTCYLPLLVFVNMLFAFLRPFSLYLVLRESEVAFLTAS